jgi:hypothetical protein
MQTTTKWLLAIGLTGAAALSVPSMASAQGFYFGVPGFGIGVGTPYYGGYPYGGYYGAPYGYYGYGRYWHPHRYRHWYRY